jgi:signal transduction histidine kinase
MRSEPPCIGARLGRRRLPRACEIFRRAQRLQCQLAASEQARLRFASSMRHDLLGPVNTLSGFLELLAEERAGPLNPTQRAWIANMRTAADRILSLVEAATKQKDGP